jgi:hypothetical protein
VSLFKPKKLPLSIAANFSRFLKARFTVGREFACFGKGMCASCHVVFRAPTRQQSY